MYMFLNCLDLAIRNRCCSYINSHPKNTCWFTDVSYSHWTIAKKTTIDGHQTKCETTRNRCPEGEDTDCPGGMGCFGNTECYYSADLVPTTTPIQSPTMSPSTLSPVMYKDPANVRFCVSVSCCCRFLLHDKVYGLMKKMSQIRKILYFIPLEGSNLGICRIELQYWNKLSWW